MNRIRVGDPLTVKDLTITIRGEFPVSADGTVAADAVLRLIVRSTIETARRCYQLPDNSVMREELTNRVVDLIDSFVKEENYAPSELHRLDDRHSSACHNQQDSDCNSREAD